MTDDLPDDRDARYDSSAVAVEDATDLGPGEEVAAGAVSGLVEPGLLEELATNLLWRIGRVSDDGPVTVRVGLASSAGLFQDLPRLRSASDAEVEAAIEDGSVRVEWVGARPRTER